MAEDMFHRTLASANHQNITTSRSNMPQSCISRSDAIVEYLLEEKDLESLPHYDVQNPFNKTKTRRFYSLADVRAKSLELHGTEYALDAKKATMRLAKAPPAPDSSHVVNAALIGNGVVLIGKTAAFIVSGSGAMLSEAIHTLADLGNQMLLKYGIYQSEQPASTRAPYGHASERYIFGLMSGVGIFFIGCGVTVYHGITLLLNPQDIVSVPMALSVLVCSGAVEAATFAVALKQVRDAAAHHRMSLMEFVKDGPDPLGVAVMMEDGAAVAGVGIATTCLGLAYITDNHVWDAVGTLGVGGLLGMVAMFLISKNRQMLVGMSVPQERLEAIKQRLLEEDTVRSLHDVRAVVVGSREIRFKAEIHFDGSRLAARLWEREGVDFQHALDHINSPEDLRDHLLYFGDEVVEALGDEVDRLEDVVRDEMPEARYVDLEAW